MNNPAMDKPIKILLVEDNAGDVRLTREAFKECKVATIMEVVSDGEEALAFLKRNGSGVENHPDIILLDLNLPKKDGREVLAEIKSDPTLRQIPVVILTTSKANQDILKCYDMHANCYIAKPVDVNEFIQAVKTIEDFWLTIVKLPPRSV